MSELTDYIEKQLQERFDAAWHKEFPDCSECNEPLMISHAKSCSQWREADLKGILNVNNK